MIIEKFNTDLVDARTYWAHAQVPTLPTIKKVGYVALSALAAVSKIILNLFLYPINGMIWFTSTLQTKQKELSLKPSPAAKKTIDVATNTESLIPSRRRAPSPIKQLHNGSVQTERSALLSYSTQSPVLRKKETSTRAETLPPRRRHKKITKAQIQSQSSRQKTPTDNPLAHFLASEILEKSFSLLNPIKPPPLLMPPAKRVSTPVIEEVSEGSPSSHDMTSDLPLAPLPLITEPPTQESKTVSQNHYLSLAFPALNHLSCIRSPNVKNLAKRAIVAPIASGTSYITDKISNGFTATKTTAASAMKVTQSGLASILNVKDLAKRAIVAPIASGTSYVTGKISNGFTATKTATVSALKVTQSSLMFIPRKLYSQASALFSGEPKDSTTAEPKQLSHRQFHNLKSSNGPRFRQYQNGEQITYNGQIYQQKNHLPKNT